MLFAAPALCLGSLPPVPLSTVCPRIIRARSFSTFASSGPCFLTFFRMQNLCSAGHRREEADDGCATATERNQSVPWQVRHLRFLLLLSVVRPAHILDAGEFLRRFAVYGSKMIMLPPFSSAPAPYPRPPFAQGEGRVSELASSGLPDRGSPLSSSPGAQPFLPSFQDGLNAPPITPYTSTSSLLAYLFAPLADAR